MSKEEVLEVTESTIAEEQFPLTHKGFGRYEVGGTTYPNKEEALTAQAKLLSNAEFENEYGDILPEGYDFKVVDHSLVFRGSLLEVPMNEVYLHDGSFNPMYDRAWYYAWAARSRSSISAYQAIGYTLFTIDELEALVDAGKAPAHYLSLLQREGENLVYEDLILMRTPRAMWRQRKQREAAASERRANRSFQSQMDDFGRVGLPKESFDLS